MKWVSMVEQPHAHKPKINMHDAKRLLEWRQASSSEGKSSP
jgi:hypothetical protein